MSIGRLPITQPPGWLKETFPKRERIGPVKTIDARRRFDMSFGNSVFIFEEEQFTL